MDDSEMNYELTSSLLCDEDDSYLHERDREQEQEQDQEQEQEQDREREAHFVSEEEEDEYVENMFKRESVFFGFGFGSEPRTRFEPAQSHALDWIFNTRVRLGFNFRTLYLSITYFDRFLSKRPIDSEKVWAIRLLSVACLSVAAKIEECQVPMLPEFPVSGYGFFESKAIQRMELLVLTELEWKMGSLTPFSYLNYFIHKFAANEGISKELIISNSVELILAMTRETKSHKYRPCIVAATAVLIVSLDGELTREMIELKTNNVIRFWGSEDIDNLCSCCDVLKEIERVRQVKTPPHELEISSNMVSLPNPLSNSAAKRRLSFNESDDRAKNRRT